MEGPRRRGDVPRSPWPSQGVVEDLERLYRLRRWVGRGSGRSRIGAEGTGCGGDRAPASGRGEPRLFSNGAGLLCRLELQGDAVHAVAQAGRLRAILENVAEVAAATGAVDLGAGLEEAAVRGGADVGGIDRRPEARPASAGVEFLRGVEKGQPTGRADEDTLLVNVVQRAGEGPLGAVLAQHVELLGREDLLPLVFGLDDFLDHVVGSFLLGLGRRRHGRDEREGAGQREGDQCHCEFHRWVPLRLVAGLPASTP